MVERDMVECPISDSLPLAQNDDPNAVAKLLPILPLPHLPFFIGHDHMLIASYHIPKVCIILLPSIKLYNSKSGLILLMSNKCPNHNHPTFPVSLLHKIPLCQIRVLGVLVSP